MIVLKKGEQACINFETHLFVKTDNQYIINDEDIEAIQQLIYSYLVRNCKKAFEFDDFERKEN